MFIPEATYARPLKMQAYPPAASTQHSWHRHTSHGSGECLRGKGEARGADCPSTSAAAGKFSPGRQRRFVAVSVSGVCRDGQIRGRKGKNEEDCGKKGWKRKMKRGGREREGFGVAGTSRL